MLINKSIKNSKNHLNILIKKQFCLSHFPFKFENQKVLNEQDIKEIIQKDLLEGFKYIYRNFIEAMNEKDEDFIRNIGEKNFAEKIIQSLKTKKVYINEIDEEDKNIEIEKLFFKLYNGVRSNREENRIQGVKKEKNLVIQYKQFKSEVRMFKGPYPSYVIMRIIVDFKTNIILNDEKIKNKYKSEIHSMIFESESQDKKILLNLLDENKTPRLINLFFKREKEIDWKITDLDNFLEGNPLI